MLVGLERTKDSVVRTELLRVKGARTLEEVGRRGAPACSRSPCSPLFLRRHLR